MLVRFQDPYTNAWKQTVTLLGECKITIHQDLRNVLVLLWVVQAAKITMQNVADKEIHTLEKWDAASTLVRFQNPYTNVLKHTVILLGQCKITIHRDLRNVLVLLWVGQVVKITMPNVAEKEIHTLEKWDAASMLVRFQDPYTNAWKQTVILLGEYKVSIHQDLRNVLVLLWVVQAAKITMQNVADKEIHTLEKWDAASMLARFQNPYTNVLKQTVIRFGECKITIPLDFRNVVVLLCVGPASKITMRGVGEKELHTLGKWENASFLISFQNLPASA